MSSSREDLKAFPEDAKGELGHSLHRVQCGQRPRNEKSLHGDLSGVSELVADSEDGNTCALTPSKPEWGHSRRVQNLQTREAGAVEAAVPCQEPLGVELRVSANQKIRHHSLPASPLGPVFSPCLAGG
jgi:hypothetical protein